MGALSQFLINYDELPISVNEYLKPSARIVDGKPVIHMYETQKAKDWKRRFISYIKREVKKQNWDKSITKETHFYLDCLFIQARTNQDNNNYYKLLCDALKDGGAIEDDKNILVRTQKVMYNAKQPHFMAVLRPVAYSGIFNDEEHLDQFVEHNCSVCKKKTETCAILRKAKEGRIQEELNNENGFITCSKRKS